MKRILLAIVAAAALLGSVLSARTALLTSKQLPREPASLVAVDTEQVAEHLSQAVRFRTVSYQDPARFEPEESSASIDTSKRPSRASTPRWRERLSTTTASSTPGRAGTRA